MREFVLYSRSGRTDSNWNSLHEAGRLDIVHECIVASFFLSHGLRRNVIFHTVLNGPSQPPAHLEIKGKELFDVRTDTETWKRILKKILNGKTHLGISIDKTSFEALIKAKAGSAQIYVLEEGGTDIEEIDIPTNSLFVLGDHVGLPKKVENFVLRYGEKVSLGKKPYLAASCISILNYLIDRQELIKPYS